MIRIDNSYTLALLFSDVHRVLREASKEFEVTNYVFEFASKRRCVNCVRFRFEVRKPYYLSVYPQNVELFNYIDRMKNYSFSGFTFVRHSVDVFCENCKKIYSVVLWY